MSHINFFNNDTEKSFTIFLLLFCVGYMHAQVTIGSTTSPVSGALLDLKQENVPGASSSKGLGMPRVYLNNESELATSLDAAAVAGSLDADQHIGLTVYNVNNCITAGEGLYTWDGLKWNRLGSSEPRRVEFFGGNEDVGTAVQGSAMIRMGASCVSNSEIILNEFQTIVGAVSVIGYATITKLIVASNGVIHEVGLAELSNGIQRNTVAFYWNENIAPVFLTPSNGSSISASVSDLVQIMPHDIIEYNGNIYLCGYETLSGATRGFI